MLILHDPNFQSLGNCRGLKASNFYYGPQFRNMDMILFEPQLWFVILFLLFMLTLYWTSDTVWLYWTSDTFLSFFVSQRALLNLLYLVEIYSVLHASKPVHIIDMFETFLRILDGSTMIYKIMAVIFSQLHLEKMSLY